METPQKSPLGDVGDIGKLDLSSFHVLSHFANTTYNTRLLNFLLAMDSVDGWTVDYKLDDRDASEGIQINVLLDELRKVIDWATPVLHRVPKDLSDILCHLTTSRCMYLIRYIGHHNPAFLDTFGQLLDSDHESLTVVTMRRRLEAFSKAKLLGDIFSSSRIERISKIMGSYSNV